MCGICGILDYHNRVGNYENSLRRICAAMKHRGPDDEGLYVSQKLNPRVGLGHRRLKIIDLSAAGSQPMCNEDKSIWIVFNGEIYNYKDLRKDLESNGHIFRSNTDTETIIHLYEEYGKDCLKFLRGMFAFAVWDEKKQVLLLARDRVGKKPLLYSYNDGIFCFASEFMGLLEGGLIKKEINYEAINYYLTFGYIPSPLSIYKNVFKLPPAHRLILENGKIHIERYWQLDYLPKISISEEDAAGEILRLLREAVKIRLYSDVPLGAFLSGGIDSSAVVALMSELSEKKVKTFSIGFEDKDYDELKFARNIADRFNTEHNEFIVRPNALEILPLLVERYGEPYADSSCVPTYYVAQQTKQFVTVALNGDGGDELFAGYERYRAMLASQMIPGFIRKAIAGITPAIPDSPNPKNKARRIKRFLNAASLPALQRYIKWVGIFDDKLKKDLYSDRFCELISQEEPLKYMRGFLENSRGMALIDSLVFTDTMTYLPEDLLVKVDITSMANSLEARSPFLDHVLMEFAAKLPAEYKIKRFVKKHILKKAVKNLIPSENIHRTKMGFGVPVGEWWRIQRR